MEFAEHFAPITVNHTWNSPTVSDLGLIKVWDVRHKTYTYILPSMYASPAVKTAADQSVIFIYDDKYWLFPM